MKTTMKSFLVITVLIIATAFTINPDKGYQVGDEMFGGIITYIDGSGYHGIVAAKIEYIRYKSYSSNKNFSLDIHFKELPHYFSPIKGFTYDIGTGYTTIDNIEIMNNCQIMSLFYSLSETF